MQLQTDAQIVELFHVAFLDVLSKRLNPARYVLKGGANLRFFFDSVRYSEDIDLDISGVGQWSLESKVDDVLESGAMKALLRVGGLAVAESTKPKQSETTRRWKVAIEAPNRAEPVRTKIEFSNRNGEQRHRLEAIPGRIVAPYALRAPSVQHYVEDAPAEQKVMALAKRSDTQARDVFDLDLLLRRRPLQPGALDPQILAEAGDRALELPFAAFRDQVLPFLELDVVELYDTAAAWEEMQAFVAEKLEEAR
ncbi:MAG TPA: nucleotidyl transferase AbiEii/AbiGii toxin family protein [Solirubrobacterales bacterium]